MIAYKGFEKNLSCRGYQFKRYGINETTEANCRQNGFHCAENPLIVWSTIQIGKNPLTLL